MAAATTGGRQPAWRVLALHLDLCISTQHSGYQPTPRLEISASNRQGLPKSGVVSGSERREEEGRQGAGPPRAGNSECPHFSAEQLKTLPGIGDADAKNIIKGRPYQGEYELVQRKIIPWVIDEQIKSKIVAKQK
jgi:hypothetical protein